MSEVIGLVGYARVGKDTVAEYLVRGHGFVRIGFADALRKVIEVVDPILTASEAGWKGSPWLVASGGHLKLSTALAEPTMTDDWLKTFTDYREFLKRLGNGAREHIRPDVWLDVVETFIYENRGLHPVVVTDVRFPNEADMIYAAGGDIIRIVRDGYGPESDFELASDDIAADVTIGAKDVPGLQRAAEFALKSLRRESE